MLYFKEQKVDYVVLETGLGGKLDATNAIEHIQTMKVQSQRLLKNVPASITAFPVEWIKHSIQSLKT